MAASSQENMVLRDQQVLLVQFVASRLSDASMREDVVQETWLRMLKYSRRHAIGNWPALARKIALNLIRDHFRAAVRHPTVEIDESQPSLSPLPEQTLMYRQKLHQFRRVLEEMPPLRRSVLIARRVEGKSYQEISRELNISCQAVEKHMTRALCQLHAAMTDPARNSVVTVLTERKVAFRAEEDHA